MALTGNFEEIKGLENRLTSELDAEAMSSFFGGTELIKAHVLVERALSNFLAATSAFRDRAIVRAKEYSEDAPGLLNAINDTCTQSYDTSFAYRLFYNLRNYAQHHASPIDVIPICGRRGDDGRMMATVRIELRRDALLRGRRMQSRVLKELADGPEVIPLVPLANEYMNCHGRIMLAMINVKHEQFGRFSAYARAVIQRMKVPKGATPIVWDGPPVEKAWPNIQTNMHGFSFDEFALLTNIMLRLRDRK